LQKFKSLAFWQRHFVVIIYVLTVAFSHNSENALPICFQVISDYFESVEKDLLVALDVGVAQVDYQTVKTPEKRFVLLNQTLEI